MKVTSDSRVSDIVAQLPRAARVFEILGINYCDDDRSFAAASAAAAYDVAEVIAILNRSELPVITSPRESWHNAPFPQLTSHIVEVYHRRARRMLVDSIELLGRVASAHAAAHPELWQIKDALELMAHQLVPHMLREERYLFPYIANMDQPPKESMVVPLFGTVKYPLQSIHHDHTEDRSLLDRIRDVSCHFTAPENACARFRILYTMLAEFADDLTEHIRLENDILFPRAIEMERKAQQQT